MVNILDFTNRLKKILNYHQLTASLFADKIGVQRSSISHILSGRNKPSLDFVMKVLQKFPEVELYWLLNGKGSFPAIKNTPSSILTISKNKTPTKKEDHLTKEVDFPKIISNSLDDTDIDRIVVFFKNGTFKSYKN